MMMDSIVDPFLNLYNDGQIPSIPDSLLFSNDDNLGGIDLDLPLPSPIKFEDTISNMTDNPEFENELKKFLANFPSPDSSSSTNDNSAIDILDDFPFSPLQNDTSIEKFQPTLLPPPLPPPRQLPVIINTTKITNQHLPKVVQLTKGNVVYIQAPNNSNKSQTNFIQLTNCLPTILINTLPTPTVNEETNASVNTPSTSIDDLPMDDMEYNDLDHLPMTPSTSSESPDERTTGSPDITHDNNYSKNRLHRHQGFNSNKSSSTMLTNLEKLPTSGPLILTDEELKLIKQEGYQIPTKLPLNKTEEKVLKKIRRKIKNKISAQESRRKKKEYVDTLERQIAKYMDENGALKERVSTMEKNQRSLMQELQSLRTMVGKGTPTTGKVLMVLCLFFAVLFGIWSPINNKQSVDDFMRSSNDGSSSQQKSLSSSSSSNGDSSSNMRSTTTAKSLLEQQDLIKQEPTYSNYIPNNYKSRVLLSFDEHDNHYHGPYLPANNKHKLSSQPKPAAPGYSYSSSVEKYMNKRFKLAQDEEQEEKKDYSTQRLSSGCLKRPLAAECSPSIILSSDVAYKTIRPNHTSHYRINEKFVVIENSNEKLDHDSSIMESKPLKIIRVERTTPAIGNDTLKLSHRTVNE
ncbi:unnamed protein product [Rotaria magnacalcarata]|uniref:BZIP domain-containing protein n=3 Tax=Rotaria magnacalcarata TaxID=392030 RepID=A0A816EE50_9BILA|nr:unnamed protein product [Rotaria magnacalcarata]CAF1644829.1 unnamed protein product [Rotaria magnacalcarata]CAF3960856.1 unnamed protein product [Rotaria magnacalcarata]CAF4072257.1 unnamed protein product [Rotaria magnacalcarata]